MLFNCDARRNRTLEVDQSDSEMSLAAVADPRERLSSASRDGCSAPVVGTPYDYFVPLACYVYRDETRPSE